MRVIGLLGGVASGKSLVAQRFAELGAGTIDADRIGHEVLLEPKVIATARSRWGEEVLDESGQIDRRRLAQLVFAPTREGRLERTYWEQVTHPAIGREIERRLEEFDRNGYRVVVLDAAVMIEAGWGEVCDTLFFIDSPRAQRLERAAGRGWSEDDFAAREAAQESLDLKRSRADLVIDNSGFPDEVIARVDRLWPSLTD